MTPSLRFFGLSVLLLCGLLGVALCRPQWLELFGVERPPETTSVPPGLEPDARNAIAQGRTRAKRAVIVQLLAGKMGLFEAAAWFRDLNAEPPDCPDTGHRRQPGDTEEEKLCRQVIDWARNMKAEKAPEGEVTRFVTRLQAELDTQLRHNGRILLPQRC